MRHFTLEEKLAALEVYDIEKSLSRTILKLGYPDRTTLYRWIKRRDEPVKEKALQRRHTAENPYFAPLSVKLDAIHRCYVLGESLQSVADEIGYSHASICNWQKKYSEEGTASLMHRKNTPIPKRKTEVTENYTKEMKKLLSQMQDMQMEIDILKETINVLKKDPGIDLTTLKNREKAVIIDALRNKYSLPLLLLKLDMSKSSYYYQEKALYKEDKYRLLREQIRDIFIENKERYGYRRIHAMLKRKGIVVSEKVVRRIMKEDNLVVKLKKQKKYCSYKGEISPAVSNIVNRDFSAEKPNQKWLTDITEFSIPAGKVYLSPIVDCFDGMLLCWKIGVSPDADLVNSMLDEAIGLLDEGENPVVHSDRGCHYRWPGWIERMEKAHLVRSMSKKGCSPDNSACEGVFGRLKNEMFYNRDWSDVSIDEFISILNNYLIWYNEERIKKSLGYMSPMEYRRNLGLIA